ncbi:hypothetical protein NDU88_002104 [Pleurodeles waltl]|uniref:Uncharacterized protein n=1 Tax=Pleurodeles waltl TaxID=8319 RepID=A0AAV7UA25_PLEWA|nr:hypothetical protein NDU88_002104 [Pleurodeles waltl]
MVRGGLSCWLLEPGVAQATDAYIAARALRDMRDCVVFAGCLLIMLISDLTGLRRRGSAPIKLTPTGRCKVKGDQRANTAEER